MNKDVILVLEGSTERGNEDPAKNKFGCFKKKRTVLTSRCCFQQPDVAFEESALLLHT
jgi:hypothetical protein